ncbi:hypothetical protein ELH16_08535 [Rhizobium ruizarguesonis]|uniref:hypothetical protein n=1 Tax=Rhizobium ruizarguesonis TaxID=2081791 RepID=UPI00102FE1A0|nr:hypothetical protein [Rhizobium ruizarguesonis]TBD68303.1 hypothetical protein ELH16_08535 [Rhizobium ruizarguesonis]
MLRTEHRAYGRLFAAAQELFKYRRDRLPQIAQRSAYQAIQIFQGIDPELFAQCASITPRALAEVAKAEPDIQALIAERIEAGDLFTAAGVKEIRHKPKHHDFDFRQPAAQASNSEQNHRSPYWGLILVSA